jgi:proteasome lid subunit RPN8/RPN11
MPFHLLLPRILLEEMVAHALSENPNECCGLLAGIVEDGEGGKVGRVDRRYPLVNAAASPVEFESDSRNMFAAVKDMRTLGIDVLAVYHSHPASPPVPSRKDLARNYSPDVVNLIVSLTTQPPTVRGWWLTDVDYREASWETVDRSEW